MSWLPVNRQGYYLEADARRLDCGYVLDPAAIPVVLDRVLDELDDARRRIAELTAEATAGSGVAAANREVLAAQPSCDWRGADFRRCTLLLDHAGDHEPETDAEIARRERRAGILARLDRYPDVTDPERTTS